MLAIQATGATLVPSALSRAGASSGDTGMGGVNDADDGEGEDDGKGAAAFGGGGAGGGVAAARAVADRLIVWSTLTAICLAAAQWVAMPFLTPLFTPLAAVQEAVVQPARVSALVQLTNGPLFAGEGIMMGLGAFGPLAALTSVGVGVMVAGLTLSSRLGLGVASVWWSLLGFHVVQVHGLGLGSGSGSG